MKISRRGLLQTALIGGGAALGTRALGPLGIAFAAPEPSHFVHIFFNGGLNALFAGCGDKFITKGSFGATSTNIKAIGNGVFTDATTFGTFPRIALDHWGAIGMKHGNALHTTPQNLNSGGERAILTDGSNCFLNELAYAMGGASSFKAVYFGDRQPAYREQPSYQGVSLQKVSDLGDAISALGSDSTNPASTNRGSSAASLEAAKAMSQRQARANPIRIATLGSAFDSAIGALRSPLPPPVTLAEINTAYALDGSTGTTSFGGMLAGAEIMIRAAGTNVVNVTDTGLASWDFHQTNGGISSNATFTRSKLTNSGGRLAAIKTFLSRMLALPDRNVVVCISGELVRLPSGDHGDGTVAALFGKYVKQGVSFPVDSSAQFASDTPPPKAFWAAVAAACKVQGQPFGANPHPLIT